MATLSDLGSTYKTYSYSIITAVVIGLIVCAYILIILPANEANEDLRNSTAFNNVRKQFVEYIHDELNEIKIDELKKKTGFDPAVLENQGYIAAVYNDMLVREDGAKKQIVLTRHILFKHRGLGDNAIFTDEVPIDFQTFKSRIAAATAFRSFYICPVNKQGKCVAYDAFVADNVSLRDRDSLSFYCRNNSKHTFIKSTQRYYSDQVTIPGTEYTLYIAAGVENAEFQKSVRFINPSLLIWSLLLVVILLLSISFIKPIVSSYKERLQHMDLVSVLFSIGILTAVLVVFGAVNAWNGAIRIRNRSDLKELVTYADKRFTKQVGDLRSINDVAVIQKALEDPAKQFSKLNFTAVKNNNIVATFSGANGAIGFSDTIISDARKLRSLKDLVTYYRLDDNGLILSDLNTDKPEFPRVFSDRQYFKKLHTKDTDEVMTGVFSRSSGKYQWIYAKRNPHNPRRGNTVVDGIAFRPSFAENLRLPNGTDYMFVDRSGNVLMSNKPQKNLYENLKTGTRNNQELVRLLSGSDSISFVMKYQGKPYQVYGQKSLVNTQTPIYILGVRDLTHLNYLSLFTFCNGFLLSVIYGLIIVTIVFIYSIIFYKNRIGIFSRQHFQYFFPDSSRKAEYALLLRVNCVSIIIALFITFISSPSSMLSFYGVFGINTALINLIVLNTRFPEPKRQLTQLVLVLWIFGVGIPLICLSLNQVFFACFFLFATHLAVIQRSIGWRSRQQIDLTPYARNNRGVLRRPYTKFLTSILINQFAVFPFMLVTAIYTSEITEYTRYYCSTQMNIHTADKRTDLPKVGPYGCDCDANTLKKPVVLCRTNDCAIERIGVLEYPSLREIGNYSFKSLLRKFYIGPFEIWGSLKRFFMLVIGFGALVTLVLGLVDYYANRFFFYDLMQAAHEKFFPAIRHEYANDHIFIPMIENSEIRNLVQENIPDELNSGADRVRVTKIRYVFDQDKKEVLPQMRTAFQLNYNYIQFHAAYRKVIDALTAEQRSVLYDFALDSFVNYKNKDTTMQLMDMGLVTNDQLTGRLRVMSPGFRFYLLMLHRKEPLFLDEFNEQHKTGTFGKLKFPIMIIAVSLLVLLMYFNKDSYDRVALVSGSVGSALLLINRLLGLKSA